MRMLLFLVCTFFSLLLQAQDKPETTSAIQVTGAIKQPMTITIDMITAQPVKDIGNLMITNHAGEVKGTAKDMKGVLLKDLLSKLELNAENPRSNSTFYFMIKASDGYTVVFSWNEIFNTAVGDKIFLVTAKDGQLLQQMPDRLLLLSAADLRTGRRFVKAVAEIIVKRAS